VRTKQLVSEGLHHWLGGVSAYQSCSTCHLFSIETRCLHSAGLTTNDAVFFLHNNALHKLTLT